MIHLLNVVCEHRSKTQWQEMHINVSALFVLGTVLVQFKQKPPLVSIVTCCTCKQCSTRQRFRHKFYQ